MKPVGKGSGYYIFEVLETGVIVKLTRTCFTSRAEAEQSLRTEPGAATGRQFIVLAAT
jgi:hypothetical protein